MMGAGHIMACYDGGGVLGGMTDGEQEDNCSRLNPRVRKGKMSWKGHSRSAKMQELETSGEMTVTKTRPASHRSVFPYVTSIAFAPRRLVLRALPAKMAPVVFHCTSPARWTRSPLQIQDRRTRPGE